MKFTVLITFNYNSVALNIFTLLCISILFQKKKKSLLKILARDKLIKSFWEKEQPPVACVQQVLASTPAYLGRCVFLPGLIRC